MIKNKRFIQLHIVMTFSLHSLFGMENKNQNDQFLFIECTPKTAINRKYSVATPSTDAESSNATPLQNISSNTSLNDLDILYNYNIFGKTALHNAAQKNEHVQAEKLINIGFDVNCQDNFGSTPLYCATQENAISVIVLLLSRYADVNLGDAAHEAPLHKAAIHNYETPANLLLEAGACINAQNDSGYTAMHYAVMNGSNKVIQILLHHKANLLLLDKEGKNPSDYIQYFDYAKNEELYKRLIKLTKMQRKSKTSCNIL